MGFKQLRNAVTIYGIGSAESALDVEVDGDNQESGLHPVRER